MIRRAPIDWFDLVINFVADIEKERGTTGGG
jgi:hypothetical protein